MLLKKNSSNEKVFSWCWNDHRAEVEIDVFLKRVPSNLKVATGKARLSIDGKVHVTLRSNPLRTVGAE